MDYWLDNGICINVKFSHQTLFSYKTVKIGGVGNRRGINGNAVLYQSNSIGFLIMYYIRKNKHHDLLTIWTLIKEWSQRWGRWGNGSDTVWECKEWTHGGQPEWSWPI